MVVRMIKIGKKAAKKCASSFKKKRRILRSKKRELIKRAGVVESRTKELGETFKTEEEI